MENDDESLRKPYRCTVSLRLRHPSVPADQISAALNLQPRNSWNADDPRPRIRPGAYWSCDVKHDPDAELEDILHAGVESLEPHKAFLQEFVETGGWVAYCIGYFTTDISGGPTLDCELLKRLADLHLNLEFDVYGNRSYGDSPA